MINKLIKSSFINYDLMFMQTSFPPVFYSTKYYKFFHQGPTNDDYTLVVQNITINQKKNFTKHLNFFWDLQLTDWKQ